MNRISAAMRISIGLAGLTLSALFAAQTLGLIPDARRAELDGRKSLCEAVAVQCCLAAQHNDEATMRTVIHALVERNQSVESAAVRRANGRLLVQAGEAAGQATENDPTIPGNVHLPIYQGKRRWGTVEIRFRPRAAGLIPEWIMNPVLHLIAFVGATSFLGYFWYLKKTLRHLDPSSVIPERVRATLDTLAEGVLVLDRQQRIVLANKAFARNTGRSAEELQGFDASAIEWPKSAAESGEYPWASALRDGVSQTGAMLGMQGAATGARTFMVNSRPIVDGDGRPRGALAPFDDVTSIEERNRLLEEMLQVVKKSRDEIHRQNEELRLLATRDPLTGCLNRRAFFTQFESYWNAAQKHGQPLSCIMTDIDHFKNVNDQFGHNVGDQVLQKVSGVLRHMLREDDAVCRFGGEEFYLLLPRVDLPTALEIADRIRIEVAAQKFGELSVTVSLGVSATGLGNLQPRDLIEQAEKALYFSKRGGRNRVTSWQDLPEDFEIAHVKVAHGEPARDADADVPIPFPAVTALISALGYRDTLTAEHSRRVADLCVATARGLMCQGDCYVMEVAALLHDIGKLGVPDAILLKPGPLTEEEWKVMGKHDRIGVEIIMAAFSSEELSEIVRTHHAWYGGNPQDPGLPTGENIPLRARILTIADAFDAMVSNRVYRKGRGKPEAFAELRKCASKQFDPVLVERFIDVVSSSDQSRVQPALTVSKQTALRIGMQIERLASALDAQDFPALSAMAGRLSATAAKEGVGPIAELAAHLEKATTSEPELIAVVALTTELLELCRSTQNSYLAASTAKAFDEPARRLKAAQASS